MLCVTEVKVVEVDRDEFVQHRMSSMPMVRPYVGNEDLDPLVIEDEHIRGRHFRNFNGDDVCIGIAADVQDVLSLPFNSFESMTRAISRLDGEVITLRSTNLRLLTENERFKAMSLFGKIKYHFRKGV